VARQRESGEPEHKADHSLLDISSSLSLSTFSVGLESGIGEMLMFESKLGFLKVASVSNFLFRGKKVKSFKVTNNFSESSDRVDFFTESRSPRR
jgi:hypothetical protein